MIDFAIYSPFGLSRSFLSVRICRAVWNEDICQHARELPGPRCAWAVAQARSVLIGQTESLNVCSGGYSPPGLSRKVRKRRGAPSPPAPAGWCRVRDSISFSGTLPRAGKRMPSPRRHAPSGLRRKGRAAHSPATVPPFGTPPPGAPTKQGSPKGGTPPSPCFIMGMEPLRGSVARGHRPVAALRGTTFAECRRPDFPFPFTHCHPCGFRPCQGRPRCSVLTGSFLTRPSTSMVSGRGRPDLILSELEPALRPQDPDSRPCASSGTRKHTVCCPRLRPCRARSASPLSSNPIRLPASG